METSLRVRDDRTLIARKTTIVGDIMSSEPLSIEGIVDGDVKTESVVGITGHVNGDIEALKVQIAGKNAHIVPLRLMSGRKLSLKDTQT